MKLLLSIFLCLPIMSIAAKLPREQVVIYQELCAKEQDPVKRQTYCHILEKGSKALLRDSIFRQDHAQV